METCKVDKEKMSNKKKPIIKALKCWAQNKAEDADEGGAATLSLTASLLHILADDIKLMAAKRATVLENKKKEVLDQQDGPKTFIKCEVESNVLMVCCERIKEKC
eukprot:4099592-Ditylum_brightwellii.AAC.1